MESNYNITKNKLEIYFDRTSSKAWEVLTTDLPVSGVRQKVRQGRNITRNTLLSYLPQNLEGKRILDAGCGTGQISIALAERGAEVVGIDISSTLIKIAKKRVPLKLNKKILFEVGDMTDNKYGTFDYVVAMDSLIHYDKKDITQILSKLMANTKICILFTITPNSLLLLFLLYFGKLFPRKDRSPNVSPVKVKYLRKELLKIDFFKDFELIFLAKISKSFYVSQAMVLKK